MITDVFAIPAFMRGKGQKYQAKELSTEVMMQELYNRGVTIEDLFGFYYTLEANATGLEWQNEGDGEEGQHGRPKVPTKLTVGDAQLAHGLPKINHEQPF